MQRAYYSRQIGNFLVEDESKILGILTRNHAFALEELQRNAWISQITILKEHLREMQDAHILFEFSIPRMGKRIDNVLIFKDSILAIEFKVGDQYYTSHAIDQVMDYSLDLKNFHEASHNRQVIPIVVSTKAPAIENTVELHEDNVFMPLKANKANLKDVIQMIVPYLGNDYIDPHKWETSIYKPTPTIIEAAQALYKGHSVEEISRSDSDVINLTATSNAISRIIDDSKRNNHKSICFITGVPGSGKTLAGLNIANERHNIDEGEHAVFLSGNGP